MHPIPNRPLKQHILLLMSNTGDGHRASAEALQAGFQRWFPHSFHIDIIDVAEYLPWPLSSLPNSYAPLTNHMPALYGRLWHATASRPMVEILARPGAFATRSALKRTFAAFDPDCIISVHPMLQHVTLDALAHIEKRIHFMTVVTDLVSAHPAWFHPACERCYVASDETKHRALRWGVAADRVRQFGLPIGLSFAKPSCDRARARRRLGLHPELPVVLLAGGGEGFGRIFDLADHVANELDATGREGQLAVICGRNQRLAARLQARTWPIPVEICGYVNNMSEWMIASDCLITKAGPGAIAEALACGLPMILSGYIPGQETGNIDYVVKNGAGLYEPDPGRAAAIAERWLGPDCEERKQLTLNARRLARPDATRRITAGITSYLEASR